MGMFDKDEQLTKQDFASNGQVFTLHSAKYLGKVDTKYGENQKAEVVAGPDRKQFVCFGVLADQIQRMDDGDLPTDVRIEQDGEANVFVPATR